MATIAILIDAEEGHLLCTFKLARRLEARGHRVHYFGVHDAPALMRRSGFTITPLLESLFPPGSLQAYAEEARRSADPALAGRLLNERVLVAMAQGIGLDGPIRGVRPDLLMTTSFQGARALILHYRYRLPVMLLTTWLRPGTRAAYLDSLEATLTAPHGGAEALVALARHVHPEIRRLREATAPFLRMRELILCPDFLSLPGEDHPRERETFFIEASIDLDRKDPGELPPIDPARRLLYVSLGSQIDRRDRDVGERFLRAVAAAMADEPGWQVLLSTRGILSAADLPPLPPWITVAPWVPQLEVLRHAALVITHGGLGTFKECLFLGVPMIAFPITGDQPDNARRIEHYGFGLQGDVRTATPREIRDLVRRVAANPTHRDNVERMRRRLEEVEASGIGAQRVEEVLARRAAPAAAAR
jgi:zeaxanthin glucosyltransferase